jgi:hypothetical protein
MCEKLETGIEIFPKLTHTNIMLILRQSSLHIYKYQTMGMKSLDFNMEWYEQVLEIFACPFPNFQIYLQH